MLLALAGARPRKRYNQNARKIYHNNAFQAKEEKAQNFNIKVTKHVTEDQAPEIGYEYYIREKKPKSDGPPSFKDYLHKFDISHVMEKIQKVTSNTTEQFTLAADLIDPTDELLNLKIEPINPNPFNLNTNRRSWIPPTKLKPLQHIDQYALRPRIYFLMQQSLYQARDSLVNMQELRSKYRNHQVYKMGYLIARADHVAQLFSGDAYKARWACKLQEFYYDTTLHKQYNWNRRGVRMIPYEYYDFEERLLNHWFEIDLLRELIARNNQRALKALKIDAKHWKKNWEFET